MYTIIEDLKKGIEIDVDKYRDAVTRYHCLLSDACLKLYDLCYLESPSELNEVEVKRGIIQEFPEFCKYLMSYSSGVYFWTKDMMLYAKYKTRGMPRSKEFEEVLTYFSNALRAKEVIELLNTIGAKVNINSKKPKILKPRFTTSEWLKDISVFNCNSPVIMEIAKRTEGTKVVSVDTSEYLREYVIVEYMGISEEKLRNAKSGKAFFVRGLTRNEELEIFHLIVSDAIECDTKFGKAYMKKRMKEATELFESKTSRKKEAFDSIVYQASRDKRNAKIAKERDKYRKTGYRSFFIDPYKAYFEVKNTSACRANFVVSKPENGKYAINYTTRRNFQLFNLLDGVSGEFISVKDVEDKGYFPVVSPVAIKTVRVSGNGNPEIIADWYYPIYGVLYNDAQNDRGEYISKSLVPLVGNVIKLHPISETKLFDTFRVKTKIEMFDTIRTSIRIFHHVPIQYEQGYKDYITDLVCAFMYLTYCQKDYEFYNTFYDYLPDDLKLLAFVEAQRQFEKIKI